MANPSPSKLFNTLFLAFLLIVTAGPVVAQEDEDQEQAPEDQPVIQDVITVTAQKREQDPMDVPIALTVMGNEEIRALTSGGADVRFLSSRAPSLTMESSYGRIFPRFYIRGLGNSDFDLNASQPVSMVFDGIVLENPMVKGLPVFDMDRIEILRGPQGTLFGRNTPAGVIKFESKKPTKEFEGRARASFGTFSTIDAEAVISGPLSDTVSARLSLLYQSRSDWIDNKFTGINNTLGGYDNTAWRLQFLFEPTDNFSGLLNLHGWENDGTARIFHANLMNAGSNSIRSGFEFDEVFYDGLNSQDISANGGSLKFDYDFGSGTFTSVTGFESLDMFSRGDVDGGFGGPFIPGPQGPGIIGTTSETADGIPDVDQFTQEFRVASNPGSSNIEWLAGFFWFDEDFNASTFNYDSGSPGNPQAGFSTQTQQADAYALFGSLGYRPSDQWHLQGGLRYSDEEKKYATARPEPVFQTPTLMPITEKVDGSNTSWDLSATYDASENVNWYARLATSFRAPAIQGRILFCPDFEFGLNPATNCVSVADEEEIFSAEVGVKSNLVDNTLRLDVTGYRYDLDGQQIVAVGGEFNTATLLNADSTEGYGLEVDLTWTPNSSWLVTSGLSYNQTEIDDPNLAVVPCGGGCTVLDPIGPNGALVDGNSLPNAPEWIFAGIIDYRSAVGDGLIAASLDWSYNDEKSFFLYSTREFVADSFELGFRVGYLFGEAKYEVALFGRNITDEINVRSGIDFSNNLGMVGEPRTLGLEFSVLF